MAATLDFTSFFTMAFLGAAPFFTAWLFLIRYQLHQKLWVRQCVTVDTNLLHLLTPCDVVQQVNIQHLIFP